MGSFANRYLYLPPKTWLEGRQNLLWPVYVWKVLYPGDDLRLGANLFQEAILGLLRAGVRDPMKLAELLALDLELIRLIIATQLQPNGWLDAAFKLTPAGVAILDEAEDSRLDLRVGYAFQDAVSGAWLPRFVAELPEITPEGHNSKGRPEFLLDRERGKLEVPFMLAHSVGARADIAVLTEAYRIYSKDLAAARRIDRTLDSGLQVQAIETLGSEATPMYLWCELYRDEGEPQPWLVSDPFRIRRAASWLRKPLFEMAPRNSGLIQKMQRLVTMVPADQCSAEEWLRRVEEGIELELWGDYPFLEPHDLIREHLGRLLRQMKKCESREQVHGEDLATIMGEAHNLLEAVLQWMVRHWPIDVQFWSKQKYWTREQAMEAFRMLGLSCLSPQLIEKLAGQSRGVIAKAIRTQDCPLNGLLAAALFCAAEHQDHPFRQLERAALDLERLPALADSRNKASGHASGVKAERDKVMDSARFAIQWMAQFHHWY